MMLGPYELGPGGEHEGIYTGDARELVRAVPDGSVDVIMIDPPFFLPAQHYKTRKKWARSVSDLSLIESFFDMVFIECARILKDDNGLLCVFCDGQSYPVMFVKLYRLFDRLTDVVWDKCQIGMGWGIRRQHELLLLGVNGSEFPGWESSVIKCAPVKGSDKIHPAQKPIALCQKILHALAPPGAIVLDMFCGSGTSLIAAYNEGMAFIGFDLDPTYAELARERVRQTQPPLFTLEQPEQQPMELACA